jgi:two-component system cell cycle sensor histidine kinase/response regulator CckA
MSQASGGPDWVARCGSQVLFGVVRTVIASFVVLSAALWIPGVARHPAQATLVLLVSSSPMVVALALANRGRLAAAANLTIATLTLCAMASVAAFGGLSGPVGYCIPLSIVAAGLLRGRTSAVLVAAAHFLFVGVEGALEHLGLAPFVAASLSPTASLVCVASGVGSSLGLIALYTREVERSQREAAESTTRALAVEHELANLIRFAPDGIAVLDASGVIEAANEAMARFAGCSAASLVGCGFADLPGLALGASRDAAIEGFARLHDRGEALWELTLRGASGVGVPVEVHGRFVTQLDGRRKVQLTVRDMSSRADAETARGRLEAELREARRLQGLGRFAGGIAHDFGNLLTPILVNAGLLMEVGSAGPRERELARDIDSAAQRARALVRQLLAFARRQRLELRAVDLNEVVRDIEPILRRLVRGDTALHFRYGNDLGALKGDRTQLEQVLVNLVANARDAMPAGGTIGIATGNATVTPEDAACAVDQRAGDYVALTVSDSGCGMTEEVRRHIFEPFFTTKGEDHGTGLGLATVHGIVTQCGGSIEVESVVGKGTVFRILLPRVDVIADRSGASESA